ncbi:TPA: Abi family protein [Vibrio parahaemolyticus]
MPSSITYKALANVLPQQRLLMYEKVFKTTDAVELHGSYIWSVKVASSLQPLLSSLEVALRNSIHNSATNAISDDWYETLSTRVRSSWKYKNRDKSNINWHKSQVDEIKNKLQGKTAPKGLNKHDLLVAKMDFGFWDNLLRACFSKNGDSNALWPQCMPAVFPNLPKGHTNTTVQTEISNLRELRNDIAHNSPVWKHKSVTDEQSALVYINAQIDKILEIIQWLSQEKVDWIEVHMLQSEARRVASKEYLHLCQRKNMDDLQERYCGYKRRFRSKLKTLDKKDFDVLCTHKNELYMITKLSV